jgi:hypothetical protein
MGASQQVLTNEPVNPTGLAISREACWRKLVFDGKRSRLDCVVQVSRYAAVSQIILTGCINFLPF